MSTTVKITDRGFSFVELVVAMGVSMIILFLLQSFLVDYFKKEQEDIRKIDELLGSQLALNFLWQNLNGFYPSLNNMVATSGTADQREFFSYLSGCTNAEALRPRTLTLSPTGQKKVSFLSWHHSFKKPIIYLPHHAYSIGVAGADASAPLSYVNMNQRDVINSMAPGMWENGRMLFVYSPVWLSKNIDQPCDTDPDDLPKQPAFVGVVNGNILDKREDIFNYANPLDRASEYGSIDDFLRKLPAMGGSSPMLFVRPVKLVTYEIVPNDPDADGRDALYLLQDFGTGNTTKTLIADRIESVELKRDNISDPVVNISIKTKKDN